jgi:peptidoglycan/xylan/chitin deacetylase (PgdA/CDA1 family)
VGGVKRKLVRRIGAAVAAFALGAGVAVVVMRPRDPSEHEAVRRLLALKAPIYCGAGADPLVALTFDDGPGPYSAQLVDLLRRKGARATFFEIGSKAAAHHRLVRAELSAGAVGNHSWSHPDLTQLETAAVTRELASTQRTIESIGGRDVLVFRPPFGSNDARSLELAGRLDMLEVLWNVDSGDASGASTLAPAEIARNLADRVRPGAIVLLHEDEQAPTTLDALRTFLPWLKRHGLHAVTVPELLAHDLPSAEQVTKGAGGCNVEWHHHGF